MCLAIPGVIEELTEQTALVSFGGLKKEVRMDLVAEPKLGDYVLVHAGFAIQKLSKAEAEETLSLLDEAYDKL